MIQKNKMPAFYIPHGGGPCFFMDWTMGPADTWFVMAEWLKQLATTLPVTPRALVVVSAHWEESRVTILSAPSPPLLYDYQGFPAHTYKLEYAASGSPELAAQAAALLNAANIETRFENARGFDHGVFIPLKLVFPEANIPIVQISLKAGLDPIEHMQIGRALAKVREDDVLIIGSGMSFHNLRSFFSTGDEGTAQSLAFDRWLSTTLSSPDSAQRNKLLAHWQDAPCARFAHPREEHLIPLMVVAGAAEDDKVVRVFNDKVLDVYVSGFRFG